MTLLAEAQECFQTWCETEKNTQRAKAM